MTNPTDQFIAVLKALKSAITLMADDPRTSEDDERWAVFSQCVAAAEPFLSRKGEDTKSDTVAAVCNGK